MRIAVCTLPGAPDDVRVWSGTPSHFLTGLRAVHDDVVTIGPLAPLAYRALNKFAGLTGKLAAPVACIAAIGAGDINVLDVLVLAATFAALWLVVALGLHYSILKGH